MEEEIDELMQIANTYNDEKVVQKMKSILPEYISSNSVYEMYDSAEPALTSSV